MAHLKQHGFTLIELVIAIAIVGILTAIAIPAYTDYVIRGQLVSGINGLSAMRTQMEQYYQDNRTYLAVAGATAATSYTPPCSTAATYGLFTVSCTTAPSANAYTITAVGKTGSNVAGFTYAIDQNNSQTTTSLPTGWGTTPAACWITKRGMNC
ncbi:MAG: type IV pilin protein [Stenotrophobium sp.]